MINEIMKRLSELPNVTLFDGQEYIQLYDAMETVKRALEQEPKTGHWIRFKEFEDGYYHIKCSECGQYWSIVGHAKIFTHCFNCGAKMVDEQERSE